MFERFTEEARNTLFIARASASSRYAPRIEPEDMLHGILIAAPSAVARFAGHAVKADALTSDPMAIGQMTGTVAATAHEAQDAIRRHDSFGIPFSGMTRDTLTYAAQEADALGHRAIGAEHLVLAGAKNILPRTGAIWLEVAERQIYSGQIIRPQIEAMMQRAGFSLTFQVSRGIEGDQFYVNRRHLRSWRHLASARWRAAVARARFMGGRWRSKW